MKINGKLILACAPALVALCACGPTEEPPSSSASGEVHSSPEASSQTSSPASSQTSSQASSQNGNSGEMKKVELDFWTTFGQSNGVALQKKADEFSAIIKKKQGVDVTIHCEYQGAYGDMLEKVTKGFSIGNTPTIAIAYPDHVANYLNVLGGSLVYNLDDYMNDPEIGFGTQDYLGDKVGTSVYDASDFVEAFLDEGTHYSKPGTYSLPLMKSSEVMFYNKQAVANAFRIYRPDIVSEDERDAFLASMSWDQLMDLAKVALDNKDKVLSSLTSPVWYDSDANFIISKMFQENIPYASIGSDGVGKIEFKDGKAREDLEAWMTKTKKEVDDGLLTTKGMKGTYGSDAFKKGQVIFEIGSSGGTGYNSPDGATFDVGIVRVPANNSNPLYVTQGPTMTFLRSSRNSDEENDEKMRYAWQFAKFITNPVVNDYLCIYGSEGYLPVRYSAYETNEFLTFMEEGETYAESAKVLINDIDGHYLNTDVFVGSAQLREQIGGALTQALLGSKSVTTALDDAIATAATYIK